MVKVSPAFILVGVILLISIGSEKVSGVIVVMSFCAVFNVTIPGPASCGIATFISCIFTIVISVTSTVLPGVNPVKTTAFTSFKLFPMNLRSPPLNAGEGPKESKIIVLSVSLLSHPMNKLPLIINVSISRYENHLYFFVCIVLFFLQIQFIQ